MTSKYEKEYTRIDFIDDHSTIITLTEFFKDLLETLGYKDLLVLQSRDWETNKITLKATWKEHGNTMPVDKLTEAGKDLLRYMPEAINSLAERISSALADRVLYGDQKESVNDRPD